jgi:transposase
MTGARLVHDTL